MEGLLPGNHQTPKQRLSPQKAVSSTSHFSNKQNQVGTVMLYGIPIVSLVIESQERLCLAQISNTLLKQYSYNEIHNRRVALGITCVQCTPVQLEILRRAGAMPVSSRRCGMITRREAERLCKSFLGDNAPPRLPDDFAFSVHHECAWGCRGAFLPSRYNSSRAKCIKCSFCGLFFSPNKFIFHSHRTSPGATYVQPDAANFNSWRRHMKLSGSPPDDIVHAWEDVKAMFNGGTRKRLLASSSSSGTLPARQTMATPTPAAAPSTPTKQSKLDTSTSTNSPFRTPTNTPIPVHASPRVPFFPDLALPISMIDYVWQNGIVSDGAKHQFPFVPYNVPWFGNSKRSVLGLSSLPSIGSQQESLLQDFCSPNSDKMYHHHSAFRPVVPTFGRPDILMSTTVQSNIIKRQANSDELLVPKKRYSREIEKPDTPPHNNQDVVTESVNKENEMRKTLENSDSCSESDTLQQSGLKTFFKREFVNDASSDSEEYLCKSKINLEGSDMSKFLTKRPSILEDSVLKFRDFSPNLLEAISNLKTEEREIFSGLSVKMFSEYNLDRNKTTEINNRKRKLEAEEQEEKDKSEEEKEEEDEPVDVETTDDVPITQSSEFKAQNVNEMEFRTKSSEKTKIWTIAKFSSLDAESSEGRREGAEYLNNEELHEVQKNVLETKKGKRLDTECVSCCESVFGNG